MSILNKSGANLRCHRCACCFKKVLSYLLLIKLLIISTYCFNTIIDYYYYCAMLFVTGVNWGKNTQVQHKILRQRTRAATIVHCQVASGRANTKEVFFYAFDLFKYNYSEFTGMPPNYIEAAQHDSFMRNRAKYHKSLYGGEAFQSRIRNREGLKGLPLRIRIASLKEDQLAVVKTQEKIVESNKASGGVVNSVMQFLKRLYE